MIDTALVRRLVETQFPQFRGLPIRQVAFSGWDNKTFHLGEHMLVRMPSAEKYAMQVEKEQKLLPRLAPLLPLSIPEPLAMGKPGEDYQWRWSIYRWIHGEIAMSANIANQCDFATSLAQFLIALQNIDTTDGPLPGKHNFYRGGALMAYDAEVRQAIAVLKGKIDVDTATELWEAALETTWQCSPVWFHGDVSTGNLLVQEGKLSAVIDFGMMGIGDPACDLTIAWTLLKGKNREAFRGMLPFDAGTWARGRAWTLWKTLIVAAGIRPSNAVEAAEPLHIIDEVLADYRCKHST